MTKIYQKMAKYSPKKTGNGQKRATNVQKLSKKGLKWLKNGNNGQKWLKMNQISQKNSQQTATRYRSTKGITFLNINFRRTT